MPTHEYYKANRERVLEKNREYRIVHEKRIKASKRRYYEKNRDRFLTASNKRAEGRREENKAYAAKWYADNGEQLNKNRKEDRMRKKQEKAERAIISANKTIEERLTYIKAVYGLDPELYLDMLAQQQDRCYICGKKETKKHPRTGLVQRLVIDHDHSTNQVRKLLCARCNLMVGLIENNPQVTQNILKYLEEHKGKSFEPFESYQIMNEQFDDTFQKNLVEA